MPSNSERQAHLMKRIALGEPVDAKYSGIKQDQAQRMYAEDLAAGVFFGQDGAPKYDPANPRSKEQMKEDGSA